MDLEDIAADLVAGCREGREAANLDKLYAPDAVSVEAVDFSGKGRETTGLDGIRGKHEWWDANFEVHGGAISEPMPHGDDRFAVIFEMDVTDRTRGQRNAMREVGIYTVADGRIVREEFFYPTG